MIINSNKCKAYERQQLAWLYSDENNKVTPIYSSFHYFLFSTFWRVILNVCLNDVGFSYAECREQNMTRECLGIISLLRSASYISNNCDPKFSFNSHSSLIVWRIEFIKSNVWLIAISCMYVGLVTHGVDEIPSHQTCDSVPFFMNWSTRHIGLCKINYHLPCGSRLVHEMWNRISGLTGWDFVNSVTHKVSHWTVVAAVANLELLLLRAKNFLFSYAAVWV